MLNEVFYAEYEMKNRQELAELSRRSTPRIPAAKTARTVQLRRSLAALGALLERSSEPQRQAADPSQASI